MIPYFVPSEKDIAEVPENILKLEELETMRLKDMEGFEQSECAKKMEVSRPAFQRIFLSAREKIADSLVNGKIIHIEGGNFTWNIYLVRCLDCGKVWMESYENMESIKTENMCVLLAAQQRLTAGKTVREDFAKVTAGGMAGEKSKTLYKSGGAIR